MANVFSDYKDIFRLRRPGSLNSSSEAQEDEVERERNRQRVADMRVWIGCLAYKELRQRLEREIEANEPDPIHGSDVSACYTFTQKGLRRALKIMDEMVRTAEEMNVPE